MKILNIAHSDLDGVVSSILVNEYTRQKKIIYDVQKARYDTIDNILNKEYIQYNKVIITDICPKVVNIPTDNILIIDHHVGVDYSKFKNKYVNPQEGESASRLVYNYFSKIGIDYNEKFKKLMEYAHDYDTWKHEYKASKALNYLYYLYSFERFFDRFKNGFDGFIEDEKLFLSCKLKHIKNILTNLEISAINDSVAFLIEEEHINDIAEELYKNRGFKYVFIYSPKRNSLSLRSGNDSIIHCGEFFQLFGGGGHERSAGLLVDGEDIIRKILDAFRIVYEEYEG